MPCPYPPPCTPQYVTPLDAPNDADIQINAACIKIRACPRLPLGGFNAASAHVSMVHRYLQDLPAGLDRFNDECLVKQRDMPEVAQNVEEVRKIVRDAMVLPPNSAFANGSALMDGFNDEPEDGMEEDGSLESASSY